MPVRLLHRLYARIFRVWRRRRRELFLALLRPTREDTLLDVGGQPQFWMQDAPVVKSIDALNLRPLPFDAAAFPEHGLRTLVGDGCALPFPDGSYDIAFSNSVLEHVGDWERQQRFAAELRRTGKRLWVQTPAFECPIEPHYLAPFVHWLPKGMRRFVARWLTPAGWLSPRAEIDALVDELRLVTLREMRALFPDCEIRTERMLWVVPKSHVAIRRG